MCAAQHQRVDARLLQRRQVFPRHRLDHRVAGVKAAVLHQRHEQRARLGVYPDVSVQRVQRPLIRPGPHRRGRGDEPYFLVPGGPGRCRAGGCHHAPDGEIVFRRQRGQRRGRHRAAGDQQRLDAEALQKPHILPGIAQQNFRRPAAVGDTGRVSKVYNVFRGEDALYLPHGGQSALPGVEHPDGSLIHAMHLPAQYLFLTHIFYYELIVDTSKNLARLPTFFCGNSKTGVL